WLAKSVYDHQGVDKSLKSAVRLLTGLVTLQILFGVEAWMMKFASGGLPELQAVTLRQGMVRTAHFLLGSAIFATAVVVALRAHRQMALALPPVRLPVHQL